jgi:hypothetical protein
MALVVLIMVEYVQVACKATLLPECDDAHYGSICESICTCVINNDNTESCDKSTGECTCTTGWEGDDCGDDINECTADPARVCPDHEDCVNTVGASKCECQTGFLLDSAGTCDGM